MAIWRNRKGNGMFKKSLMIATVVAAITLPVSLHALDSDIGVKGVGGQVSLVKPEDIGWTFGLGGQVDMGTLFHPELHFIPSIAFWWKSESDILFGEKYETKFTEVAFNGDFQYYLNLSSNPDLQPYVGAGAAIIFSRATVETGYYGSTSNSDVDFGLSLFGGTYFPIGESTKGFVEARFKFDGANTFKITTGFTLPTGSS